VSVLLAFTIKLNKHNNGLRNTHEHITSIPTPLHIHSLTRSKGCTYPTPRARKPKATGHPGNPFSEVHDTTGATTRPSSTKEAPCHLQAQPSHNTHHQKNQTIKPVVTKIVEQYRTQWDWE
jgi:hypothetical protein